MKIRPYLTFQGTCEEAIRLYEKAFNTAVGQTLRFSDLPQDPESERISLAVEASTEEVKHAFCVLSEEGRVGIPLAETFYSPCTGVVFDKFGVMWNLITPKRQEV